MSNWNRRPQMRRQPADMRMMTSNPNLPNAPDYGREEYYDEDFGAIDNIAFDIDHDYGEGQDVIHPFPAMRPNYNPVSPHPGHSSGHPPGNPSGYSSGHPSDHQSGQLSRHPSGYQSGHPSDHQSGHLSRHPSGYQSGHPSDHQSGHLSRHPSGYRSGHPSDHPSGPPSGYQSGHPSDQPYDQPSGHQVPDYPPEVYPDGHTPLHQHRKTDSLEEMNFRLKFAYLTPRVDWFHEILSTVNANNNVEIPLHVLRSLRGYPLTIKEKLHLNKNLKDVFQNHDTHQYSISGDKHLEKSIEREGRKMRRKQASTYLTTGSEMLSFWDDNIARIAATFGSNVASYFRFLRFLLSMNAVIGLLMFSFVSLPQIIRDELVDPDIKQGFFGQLTQTIFFYGAYRNASIVDGDVYYKTPLAYLLTWISVNALAILAIVFNMYYGYRQSKQTMSDKDDPYSSLAICGWDHSVTTPKGTQVRSSALATRIRELKREDLTKTRRSTSEKCLLWIIRICCNLLSLIILGSCGYLIYYVADQAIYLGDTVPKLIGDFFVKYQLSFVVSGLKLLIPNVLTILLIVEKWHPRTEIKLQILRTAVFYMASLAVFLFSVYKLQKCEPEKSGNSENSCCWENNLAEQIFQITLLDFCINTGVGLLTLGGRSIFVSTCHLKKIDYAEFKVAVSILDLVYSQALVWVGLFLAPFLAWFGLITLFLTFYMNYFLVRFCCIPSNTVFRASRSGSFFRFILLVTLLGCLVPLTYAIANFKPSEHCGPFRDKDLIYKALTDVIGEFPDWLQKILQYLSTPVVALPIFILLILMIVYYKVKSTSHQSVAKSLQNHLQFERKVEKRRLLAKATKQRGISNQTGGSSLPY